MPGGFAYSGCVHPSSVGTVPLANGG